MRQAQTILAIETAGQALIEITDDVSAWLRGTGMGTGLVTLLCRHTSAGILINENAAPAVRRDLLGWLARIAPESGHYEHDSEGPDDMPAHIRTLLTGAALSIPFDDGALLLGTWQGIFLAEHRVRPHRREIVIHATGA